MFCLLIPNLFIIAYLIQLFQFQTNFNNRIDV